MWVYLYVFIKRTYKLLDIFFIYAFLIRKYNG